MSAAHCWPLCQNHQLLLHYPLLFEKGDFRPATQAEVERHVIEPLLKCKAEEVARTLGLPATSGKVWKEGRARLANDLHRHLLTLLGKPQAGKTGTTELQAPFHAHPPLEVAKPVNNQPSLLRGRNGLALRLSPSARKRLAEEQPQEWLPFEIEKMTLQLFGTGVAIVTLRITLLGEGPHASQTLTEAANALCRLRNPPKIGWSDGEETAPESLEKVIHAFLAPAMRGGALRLAPCPVPRLFSFTAVTLETPTAPQQVELLAFRLARRYTDAYLPRREVITPCLYRPFDDITHAMSLEGGAIVVTVEQQRQREFVADFLSNRVTPLYQPLALIAYQEYLALLRLTQGIPLPLDLNHPDEAQRITLQHYKNWLLNFRLNFRFSHASGITMHNAAYEKWRTALSLDPLLHEVTKDVEEVEHYLDYRLNEQQQQRWSTFNHVQTGLGILIGTAIALTSFFGMNFEATKNMAFSDPFPVKVAFLAAAIGIAATGIYALIAIGLRRR